MLEAEFRTNGGFCILLPTHQARPLCSFVPPFPTDPGSTSAELIITDGPVSTRRTLLATGRPVRKHAEDAFHTEKGFPEYKWKDRPLEQLGEILICSNWIHSSYLDTEGRYVLCFPFNHFVTNIYGLFDS